MNLVSYGEFIDGHVDRTNSSPWEPRSEKFHSVAGKPAAPVHSAIRWKFDTGMLNPIWTPPPPNPGSMYNCSNHIVLLLHVTPLYIAYIKVLYIILDDFYPPRCSKDSVAACSTA